jgi:hypothetical protein
MSRCHPGVWRAANISGSFEEDQIIDRYAKRAIQLEHD